MNKTEILTHFLYITKIAELAATLKKKIKTDELVVLGYHRVCAIDGNDPLFNKNLISCDAEQFYKEIKFLKKHYDILTFQEYDTLPNKHRYRIAIITFDDGYLDNYQQAFPILLEHNAKAVFYVVPGIISGHTEPWWEIIAYYGQPNLSDELITLSPKKMLSRIASLKQASTLPPLPAGYFTDSFMSWDQLRKMAAQGMEIGCHTMNHFILSRCSEDEIKNEIGKAKNIIEAKTNTNVISMAYPVGGITTYDKKTVEIARSFGIKYGLTYNDSFESNPFQNNYQVNRLQSEYFGKFHHFCARLSLPELIKW